MQEETGPPSEETPPEANSNPATTENVRGQRGDSGTEGKIEPFTIGSKAGPQTPKDVVYTSETPPDQIPAVADNSPATTGDAQTPNEGAAAKDQAIDANEEVTPMPKGDELSQNPATTPPRQKPVEEEVQERYSNLQPGDKFVIGKKEYTIDKFDDEEIAGKKIVRVRLKEQSGNTYNRYDHELKAELEKQVIAERKRDDKAWKEFTNYEDQEAKDFLRDAQKAEQVRREQETSEARVLDQKVEAKLRELETGQRSKGATIHMGDKRFIWQGVDKEDGAYRAKDEQGNQYNFSLEQIKGALRGELTKESKGTLEERIESRRNDLEAGKNGGFFWMEGKPYRFSKLDPKTNNQYAEVVDENHQIHYLPVEQIDSALEAELIKENQTAIENLKPGTQEKLAQAGRGLKEVSERAASLLSSAKESKVSRFLVEQGKAFLNKFDPRDKEKIPYLAGIAVGAGSNVALTYFTPLLAFGPGRLVRSAAFSGVMLGVSKGANVFRHMSMNKVLSNFGVEDKTERSTYTKQYDEAFKLLSNKKGDEYGEAMKKLSADIFAKHGNAQSGSNIEAAASQITAEELTNRIETLGRKYSKLNKRIRSFAAGLSAGSLTSTLGFGVIAGIESAIEKSGESGGIAPDGIGDQGEGTPAPDGEDAGITDNGAAEGGEIASETPPSLSEILEGPEYASSIEIQQGDTIGQLLTNGGYDIDWGPDNAEVFGAHIEANYDMLQGMNEQVAAAGISVEDFPTQAEVSTLVEQARAGDAVAMHRLTEAMHWIPTGGEFTILSPEAVELINSPQGG